MNTYIALRPFIGQQIIEALKKLPYTDVCGIIGEINDAMNYPVQLNWNPPVEEEEKQRRPIGFRCVNDEDGDGETPDIEEPEEEPTIICRNNKRKK